MIALPGPGADQWDALAARSGNLFGTRAWAECWWTHYGQGATPLVVAETCSRNGSDELAFLLPLVVSGRVLRQVRFLGHGPADQLGPLCGPEARGAAAAALTAVLSDGRARADVLVAQNLPESEGWEQLLGGTVVRREDSPVVRLPTRVWDEFLAGRSKNFREQTRRKERTLRKKFDVRLRLADADTLATDLATLFRLHLERWGADAPFATGVERRFHEDFAPRALESGWLRLWVLELDGAPVAALYGFRFAGAEYFHQSGRDPEFESHSVGSVLLTHSIRSAIEDGMGEYRLLRGDEAYKSRFADVEAGVHTVALGRGVRGRAAVAAARRRPL